MRTIVVSMLALAMGGCIIIPIPVIHGTGYEYGSRQNVPDAVPEFLQSGGATVADVLLALGDPDAVAADRSWMAYVSSYGEGGFGAAALLLAPNAPAMGVGANREKMLYRRLVVRFDPFGFVTTATLEIVHCTNSDGFIFDDGPSKPPCFPVDSRDLGAREVVAR